MIGAGASILCALALHADTMAAKSSMLEHCVTLNSKIDYSDLYRRIPVGLFNRWKPKGKMYSLKCTQCGAGFLSSYNLDAPICGKCLQKAKSLDSTVDHEKVCVKCGNSGVIYGKELCHACYFGFNKQQE